MFPLFMLYTYSLLIDFSLIYIIIKMQKYILYNIINNIFIIKYFHVYIDRNLFVIKL